MTRRATTVGDLKAQIAELPDSYVIAVEADEMDSDDAVIVVEVLEGATSDGHGTVLFSISDP